jgi:hypothetical protein
MAEMTQVQEAGKPPRPPGTGRAGTVAFSDLVWSHYLWEQRRRGMAGPSTDDDAFFTKLKRFEKQEGTIVHAYWSTRAPSAVAMTEKDDDEKWKWWNLPGRLLRLREHDRTIQLHRLTDWATRGEGEIAALLHQSDLLAIKVGEILRGTPERIAMRWILGVQEHLLGFIERSSDLATTNSNGSEEKPVGADGAPEAAHRDSADGDRSANAARVRLERQERQELVRQQQRELVKIENYYHRAAGKAGRIVYFGGMLIGTAGVIIAAVVISLLLWWFGLLQDRYSADVELLFLCYGAGALGALVSAMSRISKSASSMDFEIGRQLLRRLGVFRPFVGAIFGVVLFFLIRSGVPGIEVPEARTQYFYLGLAAFLAGFSERWATVMIGGAQRTIGGTDPEDDLTRAAVWRAEEESPPGQ